MTLQKNSYGAPIKYKCVYTSKHGIPFVKRINKKGNPTGKIYSCMGGLETDDYDNNSQPFEFTLDPDYADSILLQDGYDPVQLHKSKKDIWKSVTEHNKSVKIPTWEMKEVTKFFGDVVIGDTVWTSNVSFYLVQDKKTISPSDFNHKAKYRERTRLRGPFIQILTVLDKKGKVRDISPDFFHKKALYKERPRTYKELNI